MNELETLNSVATNHYFFQLEAHKALCEMFRHAFNLSDPRPFEEAKARFELARNRCAMEMQRLED